MNPRTFCLRFTLALALALAAAGAPLFAQTPAANSRLAPEATEYSHNRDAALDERRARDWDLRPDEWTRYRQLMQGPLGVYSPNLDPLTALGIEARHDEERTRYAELQVRAEARRVEKLLAYQRAYDDAWRRLYPDRPRVDLSGMGVGPGDAGRLAVFVKDDCVPCEQRVRQLHAAGTAFDLYFVDAPADDARLRQWARKAGIDPARVRARTITLNHDGGRWRALGLPGELPAVLREVDGAWRRQ
ncbi:MAG: TIGR03759 family integrating conjugative element protein [Candidatus Accumulibacter sp.]|jgi:integrating conjugative element protein (TIGR03759 family)|nr:TIGR03759 family integrating conjugative element protein [Accumulibacter sp.]